MADASHGPASFGTQADALLRKNLTFQRRNTKTNLCLILFPFLLCSLLIILQTVVNGLIEKEGGSKCGCACVDKDGDGRCETVCGLEYSTVDQAFFCPIPSPQEWPALLQVPAPGSRAVKVDFLPSNDFPNPSCRRTGSCPVTLLITGNNQSFGQSLARRMFPSSRGSLSGGDSIADFILGSDTETDNNVVIEPGLLPDYPAYIIQSQCKQNSSFSVPIQLASNTVQKEIICVRAISLWRNSSSEINKAMHEGYWKGNPEREVNEFVTAYDFSNSNRMNFNVSVWYNSTFRGFINSQPMNVVRVPRSVNLVSNTFLQLLKGPGTKILLDFIKEMPKHGSQLRLDFSSLIGTLFFTWVILLLFPVMLGSLVYEKQQNLRIMMKMHGLGDGPYWMISYAYFLSLSIIYMFCFVVFGSVIGLNFFLLNSYSIQFVFYFIFLNLQISLAFLASAMFSDFKSATVVAYISVFGTGLLGAFLFQFFLQDPTFPKQWIIFMELYPGFALYRGLFEFGQYAFNGSFMGAKGMTWENLNEQGNGMKEVFLIMSLEWVIFLVSAYYIDQVISPGTGIRRSPLFFLETLRRKTSSLPKRLSSLRQESKVSVEAEKADVEQEREKVEHLISDSDPNHSIIAYELKKVYPGRDGNPDKFAVRGLSLAIPKGECFGMLGPNGAGKTSFINMMIGLTKPTSGTAIVQELDIRTQMDLIYTSMGVCPQHDLLWETLTGKEHLLFYGRLKNLKGSDLHQAVEDSLKSVNLFNGGVKDKQAGKYSGGMKRRLSVAISLIGNPKVVYMDEPSTGLDPASRNNLWNVVKQAKRDRAIILTTHSMEEAEVLCDRLGIFVDGSLQCIGNPKELKARFGGSYIFTMTTAPDHEDEVERLARSLSPNATKVYQISGTQKFELPKHEVRIADVFRAVGNAKSKFTVQAWGITDTTLEDVFIKVARGAQAFNVFA
uniref:ABC transporter domain-containing protein n=2 Tax=Kalanchoe fedtschenkoi TaxID=63787 RepID=A0A7N0U007_KALFE